MNQSRTFKAGLVILGLLSVADLFGPLMTDGETPPMSVALAGSVLGLLSLGAIFAVTKGSRAGLVLLLVLRAVSALSAIPAFFVADVPAMVRGLAAAHVVLTIAGAGLVLTDRRIPAGAR